MISWLSGVRTRLDALALRFAVSDFMMLWLRLWVAQVFFAPGRTKTGGTFLHPSSSAIMLFENDYALPLIAPAIAAQLAIYLETFGPILLMLGLLSRLSATALLGMTLVIQFLVYPGHFAEHLTWAAAFAAIIIHGPGKMSLDQLLFARQNRP